MAEAGAKAGDTGRREHARHGKEATSASRPRRAAAVASREATTAVLRPSLVATKQTVAKDGPAGARASGQSNSALFRSLATAVGQRKAHVAPGAAAGTSSATGVVQRGRPPLPSAPAASSRPVAVRRGRTVVSHKRKASESPAAVVPGTPVSPAAKRRRQSDAPRRKVVRKLVSNDAAGAAVPIAKKSRKEKPTVAEKKATKPKKSGKQGYATRKPVSNKKPGTGAGKTTGKPKAKTSSVDASGNVQLDGWRSELQYLRTHRLPTSVPVNLLPRLFQRVVAALPDDMAKRLSLYAAQVALIQCLYDDLRGPEEGAEDRLFHETVRRIKEQPSRYLERGDAPDATGQAATPQLRRVNDVLQRYERFLSSPMESAKRSYLIGGSQWKPGQEDMFEDAYAKYGDGPKMNKKIAAFMGQGVHPNHIVFFKRWYRSRLRREGVVSIDVSAHTVAKQRSAERAQRRAPRSSSAGSAPDSSTPIASTPAASTASGVSVAAASTPAASTALGVSVAAASTAPGVLVAAASTPAALTTPGVSVAAASTPAASTAPGVSVVAASTPNAASTLAALTPVGAPTPTASTTTTTLTSLATPGQVPASAESTTTTSTAAVQVSVSVPASSTSETASVAVVSTPTPTLPSALIQGSATTPSVRLPAPAARDASASKPVAAATLPVGAGCVDDLHV